MELLKQEKLREKENARLKMEEEQALKEKMLAAKLAAKAKEQETERQRKEQEAIALKRIQMEEETKIAQETYRRRIEEQKAKERERMEQNKHDREREEEIIRKQQRQREQLTHNTSSRADRMHPKNPDADKEYERSQSTLRKHLDRIFLVFDDDDEAQGRHPHGRRPRAVPLGVDRLPHQEVHVGRRVDRDHLLQVRLQGPAHGRLRDDHAGGARVWPPPRRVHLRRLAMR